MNADFFAGNRARLIEAVNGGVAVFAAHTKMQGGADEAAPFEQEANFWWLTGIAAPDWLLLIDGPSRKSWLVAPDIEDNHQLFDGSLAPDIAVALSGADGVLGHDEALSKLRGLAKKHPLVYSLGEPPYAKYVDFTLNPARKKIWELLERTFASVHDCRKELARLRAIKQPVEIAAIKKALGLTIDTFQEVKTEIAAGRYEYEVEAELTYRFRKNGATHAFDPIVAAGTNACTLHYSYNAARIGAHDLVLIDAGARLAGYPADLTRTYAVNEPTERQAVVHRTVQSAEKQIIALLKPELPLDEYSRSVDGIMKEALVSLGLMRGTEDDENYRRYFPHAVSHGLGVDVHDSLGGWKFLQPNMILTVEPGIYIPEEGIGVRIEDNILISETGYRNLSGRLSTDT